VPAAAPAARLPWIDAARGIAIAAMVVYHSAWNLSNFGFIGADVGRDLSWIVFARLIAGSFLALVGVSLVLATRHGLNLRRYLQRLAMIVAGALAVTAATWFVFPNAFVFFGILHSIAVASVLGLVFVRLPALLLAVSAVLWFLIWWFVQQPVFDYPALLWVGLGTLPVQSNDYVPLFPWFGVVLAGMVFAKLAVSAGRQGRATLIEAFAHPAPWPLVWAGRHSLAIYLLHQPVLFGLTWLASLAIPPDIEAFRTRHFEGCMSQCIEAGQTETFCQIGCGCLTQDSEDARLAFGFQRGSLTELETARYSDLVAACREAAEQSLTTAD
jgi:uncharacterized membrane protein